MPDEHERKQERETERDEERVASRADSLSTEEERAGSDDPAAQAAQILDESDARVDDGVAAAGDAGEHRRSEDTVDQT